MNDIRKLKWEEIEDFIEVNELQELFEDREDNEYFFKIGMLYERIKNGKLGIEGWKKYRKFKSFKDS